MRLRTGRQWSWLRPPVSKFVGYRRQLSGTQRRSALLSSGFVRLDLPLPPMLLDAIGYSGAARYVALWWDSKNDRLCMSDGHASSSDSWQAWVDLGSHPLSRSVIPSHLLGDGGRPATHHLLCDRTDDSLAIGPAHVVMRVVRTQSAEVPRARLRDKNGRKWSRSVASHRGGARRIRQDPQREFQQLEALGRWLDRLGADRLEHAG
jgi:hypothetical protein